MFLFKISTGTRKHFFEICKQFGHAPSETFANSGISDIKFPVLL